MSPFPSLNLPNGEARCIPGTVCPEVVGSTQEGCLWTDGTLARGVAGLKAHPEPEGFLESLGASRGDVDPGQGQYCWRKMERGISDYLESPGPSWPGPVLGGLGGLLCGSKPGGRPGREVPIHFPYEPLGLC